MTTAQMLQNMQAMTQKQLKGCIIRSDSGVNMYTPDGMGNYTALWTRDFTYMVEYAGEWIPTEDIRANIEYLLEGAGQDGWIPDRVDGRKTSRYTAGDGSIGLPNLDNASFVVIATDEYMKRVDPQEGRRFFQKWYPVLQRGLDVLPKDDTGLIFNDPDHPHSPYGFTDCIGKTGSLLMESLLYWRALKILSERYTECNLPNDHWIRQIAAIEKNLYPTFHTNQGVMVAATVDCRQIDIWANCYAVSIGFPLPDSVKADIGHYMLKHSEDIVESGQIRHLVKGEYWSRLLSGIPRGEYQNGAYWATAAGWFADAIAAYDRNAAEKVLTDVYTYFQNEGIFECVNGEYQKLNNYVASATNVYHAMKKYLH